MNKKIARIEKLVNFEKHILKSMTQDMLSLNNQASRIDREMNRLSQSLESEGLLHSADFDHVASQRAFSALAETVQSKISELRDLKATVQEKIEQAQDRLGQQKVRVNVLEQLLSDRTYAQQLKLGEEQIRELLDIANRKFLESHA